MTDDAASVAVVLAMLLSVCALVLGLYLYYWLLRPRVFCRRHVYHHLDTVHYTFEIQVVGSVLAVPVVPTVAWLSNGGLGPLATGSIDTLQSNLHVAVDSPFTVVPGTVVLGRPINVDGPQTLFSVWPANPRRANTSTKAQDRWLRRLSSAGRCRRPVVYLDTTVFFIRHRVTVDLFSTWKEMGLEVNDTEFVA